MTRIHSYLNLYFAVGVGIFSITKIYPNFTFLNFYIYYNLAGILILLILLFQSREIGNTYARYLVCGYISFLVGNLTFLNFVSLENLTNILFLVQVIVKQCFIFDLYFNNSPSKKLEVFHSVILLNLLLLIISFFIRENYQIVVLDSFFFLESLISFIVLCFINLEIDFYIDFNIGWFLLGQLTWLGADLIYSDLNILNLYIIGDVADFIYFVGFYFFIKSLISKEMSSLNLQTLDVAKTFI